MSVKRLNISSGSKSEAVNAYSRAVIVDKTIYVSGTTGMNYEVGSFPVSPGDQFHQMMKNIDNALRQLGSSRRDIVQATFYMVSTDVGNICQPLFYEAFKDIRPACEWIVYGQSAPIPCALEMSVTAVLGCGDYEPVGQIIQG